MGKTVLIQCDHCNKEMLIQNVSHQNELIPNGIILTEMFYGPRDSYYCSWECLKDAISRSKNEQ